MGFIYQIKQDKDDKFSLKEVILEVDNLAELAQAWKRRT